MAFALPKNIAGLERDLKKYRIVYDNWFRESTLHQNGQVKWVVDELTKRGYTYEQEGARLVQGNGFRCGQGLRAGTCQRDPHLCGTGHLLTTIIMLMVRKFDKAIDILGADHHGYVPRLKAALTALGADAAVWTWY